ncbi:TcfC E-set like domain-containing protein [Vibrio sp. M250220]|uniref:CS1-pili formation C-terminal domain-containing protein n=1 Tax=Vibrio sp. M250220 TaxID=3020894 RepID=UPI002F41A8C9
MNITNNLALFFLLFSSYSVSSVGSSYPPEFSDFFEYANKQIDISIIGSKRSISLLSSVNFDDFRVVDDDDATKQLRDYLLKNNIKDKDADHIVSTLVQGIGRNQCEDEKDKYLCIENRLKNGGSYYDYDFDNEKLSIYVNHKQFNESSIQSFHDGKSNIYSLINSTSLYFDKTDDQAFTYFRDELTLGLPYGHLYFDGNVKSYISSDQPSEYSLDTAIYTLNFDDKKIITGQSLNNVSINEADFLNQGMNFSTRFFAFGNSMDLALGGTKNNRRIYYYADNDARIEVVRGQQVLLTKVVKKGANYISYDELPRGVYNIEIIEKSSTESRVLDRKFITNNPRFSATNTKYNYQFGVAQSLDSGLTNDLYGFAKGSYRLNDKTILGSAFSSNGKDIFTQLGTKLALTENSLFSYSGGWFDNGSNYNRLTFDYYNFYAQMERYVSTDSTSQGFNSEIYGVEPYSNASLGLSGIAAGSRYYLQYDINEGNFDYFGKYGVLSAGINRFTPFGTLNFYGQYQRNERADDWTLSLTWTYDLGSGFSTSLSHRYKNDRSYVNEAKLSHSYMKDSLTTNLSLTGNFDNNTVVNGYLTGFASSEGKYMGGDAYVSLDKSGRESVSVTLKNTQILDNSGISFTAKKSNAFAKFSVKGAKPGDDVEFSLKNNNTYIGRELISNEERIIPVQSYTELDVYVDEGVEQQRSVKRFSQFMYPGTVLNISTQYSEVKTDMVILEDFYGNPIKYAQCVGKACVSIEPVTSDGVFRISTTYGEKYQIVSQKSLCVLGQSDGVSHLNGICMTNKQATLSTLIDYEDISILDEEDVFFVGRFEDKNQHEFIISQLKQSNINYLVKQVGNSVFLFITENSGLSVTQLDTIKTIQSFVVNLEGRDSFYSINSISIGDDDV